MAISLKTINAELARLGYNGSLERGDGYFYFRNGEVVNWLDFTVSVPTLNSLTLEQWMEEFRKLREKNHAIVQSAKGSMNERDFKKHLEELAKGKPEAEHTLGQDPQPSAAQLTKKPAKRTKRSGA